MRVIHAQSQNCAYRGIGCFDPGEGTCVLDDSPVSNLVHMTVLHSIDKLLQAYNPVSTLACVQDGHILKQLRLHNSSVINFDALDQ